MDRINIYGEQEGPDGRRPLIGWFDRDAARAFDEETLWDGRNHISVATGSQWDHEEVYRTAQDRWVLRWWSQQQGSQERHTFITADQARDWLLANHHDDDVAALFGEVEQERGPGRPTVGTPINIRLTDGALAQVDRYASDNEMSRAAAIRELLGSALDVLSPQNDPELGAWISSAAVATCSLHGRLVRSLLNMLKREMDAELAGVAFTEAEAKALANAHSATIPGLALGQIAHYEMLDAFADARRFGTPSSYQAHFGINEEQLLGKLEALTPLGDLALRLAIARWWQLLDDNEQDDSLSAFERAGIRIELNRNEPLGSAAEVN